MAAQLVFHWRWPVYLKAIINGRNLGDGAVRRDPHRSSATYLLTKSLNLKLPDKRECNNKAAVGNVVECMLTQFVACCLTSRQDFGGGGSTSKSCEQKVRKGPFDTNAYTAVPRLGKANCPPLCCLWCHKSKALSVECHINSSPRPVYEMNNTVSIYIFYWQISPTWTSACFMDSQLREESSPG